MKFHELQPADGSKQRANRLGRGTGGKGGKTAGRGTKGQHARNTVAAGFEGGQTPLYRRSPKLKGFTNPFRVEYVVVNLDTLDKFDSGTEIDPGVLRSKGLIAKNGVVKVLGRGQISKPFTVRAHAFSDSAKQAIEGAGGQVQLLPLPWGDRRPPASGNALTNR